MDDFGVSGMKLRLGNVSQRWCSVWHTLVSTVDLTNQCPACGRHGQGWLVSEAVLPLAVSIWSLGKASAGSVLLMLQFPHPVWCSLGSMKAPGTDLKGRGTKIPLSSFKDQETQTWDKKWLFPCCTLTRYMPDRVWTWTMLTENPAHVCILCILAHEREASPAATCKKTPATGVQGHGSGVGWSRAGASGRHGWFGVPLEI